MKRLLVVSMLSLALAGCAQSKGALSRGASYPPSPVALTPVPSLYDTVNQGMGGKAVAQTAIANPDDPQWAGRAPYSVAAGPVPPGPPAAGPGAASAAPAVAAGPQSPGQPMGTPPALAAPAAPPAMPPIENQVPAELASSSAMPAPAELPPPGPAMPGLGAAPDPRTVSSGPIATDPGSIPLSSSSAGPTRNAVVPAEVAVSPPASVMPAPLAGAPGPQKSAPKRSADPLLGPDPDLMPTMPELPPVQSNKQATPSAGPQSLEPPPALVPAGATPATSPAEPPAAGPAVSGAPGQVDPPIGLDNSTAAGKPADGGLAAADLPLERAPPTSSAILPAVPARATAPGPAAGRSSDPHVILTSSQEPKGAASKRTASMKEAGRAVARVGDEIITQHEFKAALLELISKYPELRDGRMDGASQLERSQVLDHLARQSLAGLIDRSLLVQDAKRHIKDKKMLDQVNQEADKVFHEQEVLPLQRKFNVDSEAKVKEKLAEQGRSLEAMRLSFRQVFLAQSYLYQKVKDRTKVDLPDLLKYYNEHVYKHEFDRPAQITWRELVIENDKQKGPELARKKANALLEKVRRGDDFATLARTESDGPTSSRKEGGLMETTPGSCALKPINDALDSLPIGQVSEVIEGPDSFHILKVEKRRPAGPASFEDVQDKIKPMLESQKMNVEQDAFLKKIKQNALISIYLDKNDPKKP